VAWSGGAGADDHGQPPIALTDGSRESQPSGLELLPDLPPRDFVLGGLTIAPQLAVGEGALAFRPALREVFPATRQPRCQVHQPADVLSKLPLLCAPTRWALLVLFQRPMTTVFRNPWVDEEEMLARSKHGATLCLRTQRKCHKPISHNELRYNEKISQVVFIRSHIQSQRAPP